MGDRLVAKIISAHVSGSTRRTPRNRLVAVALETLEGALAVTVAIAVAVALEKVVRRSAFVNKARLI